MSLTAFHHARYAAPIGDAHVMPMRKFALVADAARRMPGVRVVEPEPVVIMDLQRVHAPGYVNAVKDGHPRALSESQKFPWSPDLFGSVCLTSGGCYAAARAALTDGVAANVASGFHHAHRDCGEGFCTFNGLVVALDKLRHEGAIRTAAVLDCDLHYGNGTARLAATRPYLTAVSVYGNDYWDNTPYRDVTVPRHTDGENHLSLSLPAGCDGSTMTAVLDRALELVLSRGRPDVLLYQAGADPLRGDPYSPLDLTHADLQARDRRVFAFAKDQGLPVAWVLAGGYTPDVAEVVKVHTNTFGAALDVYGTR